MLYEVITLNFNGQTQIAGNFTSLSKQLKGFEFYSPYIGGDLAYFSDMSLTIIRLVGVNAYGSIANLANSVVVGLESMPNITGDVSELTYTLSLTTALTIRACAALTLSTVITSYSIHYTKLYEARRGSNDPPRDCLTARVCQRSGCEA